MEGPAPAQDAPCLFLPRPLWCLIIRHGLAAAAAEGHFEALRLAAVLLATSRHVAAACREVALHLDLSKAPEEDLALLLPLLTAVPLRQLLLAPWHAAGAEALLRCDAVVALSAPTLRHLAATVACTDTLQLYPSLTELHLHAGVLDQLYPAVLHGLRSLRCLGLHGYREAALGQLPPDVAASLQVLEVTPRPAALRCYLSLHLPHSMRLHQLTVHGSFLKILSVLAAPEVVTDARALARQCARVRVEAQQVVWQLPASCRGHPDAEAALAGMLLQPDAAWERMELRLLDGACVELPPVLGPAGLPPRRTKLDLQKFTQVLQRMGGGRVCARLRHEPCSIFSLEVLELERAEAGYHAPDATANGAA